MLRVRCSRSGPRTFLGSPLSVPVAASISGSVPTETVFGPGPPPDLVSDNPGLSLDPEVELVSDNPGLSPALAPVVSTGLPLPSRLIPELELVPDEERSCC